MFRLGHLGGRRPPKYPNGTLIYVIEFMDDFYTKSLTNHSDHKSKIGRRFGWAIWAADDPFPLNPQNKTFDYVIEFMDDFFTK